MVLRSAGSHTRTHVQEPLRELLVRGGDPAQVSAGALLRSLKLSESAYAAAKAGVDSDASQACRPPYTVRNDLRDFEATISM